MQLLLRKATKNLPVLGQFDAVQHMHSEWRLMLPVVGFGIGCALYVATDLPFPSLWIHTGILFSCLFAGVVLRIQKYPAVVFLAAVSAGTLCAGLRIAFIDSPIVKYEHFREIEGKALEIEGSAGNSTRLSLELTRIDGAPEGLPAKVRLIARGDVPENLKVGALVRLPVILRPPQGPIVPGGFDFSRRSYFSGIGAEGFVAGPIDILEDDGNEFEAWAAIQNVRIQVADRLLNSMNGDVGGIAAALAVGRRDEVSNATKDDFRDAGLAHLMAISGLHMGLVTAAAFFTLELVIAFVPIWALRLQPKKAAAFGAWIVALGYLLLSGAGTSTIRAFIMVSVGLLAVVLDRRVLSLRSVALAAIFILTIWPESVVSVGFQMSFAATSALVAFFEKYGSSALFRIHIGGPVVRAVKFLLVTLATTLVAELAISPFALYHFQATSMVGLAANLLAVPLTSLVIMPLLLLYTLLLPVGLESLVVPVLEPALQVLLWTAHFFGGENYAVFHVPQTTPIFLVVSAFGLISVLLTRGRMQVGIMALALLVAPLSFRPVHFGVLIDNGGRVVAQSGDETFAISGGRRGTFRDLAWARFWGNDLANEPEKLQKLCTMEACVVQLTSGETVAIVKMLDALRQHCATSNIVVLPRRWKGYCKGSALQISEEDIEYKGPAAIDLATGSLSWSRPQGNRPWNSLP
ncbi:MAG: ComEC family competence protein [Alphaproteobacteria bacterium]|nr:ComEC family competence protein [Alphaproteobacteria bacterium]